MSAEHTSLSSFVEDLQAAGRYSFTTEEAAKHLEASDATIWVAVERLKEKGRIVSPRRGFHVIVPLEYRAAGGPPASWFIDELMAHLAHPYYVALLSAAAIHGAAHQQPQVFQVITDVPLRPVEMERVAIEFHRNRNLDRVPVQQVKTETGYMRASTAEATAIDLVRYPDAAGHLNNVATVLGELGEAMSPAALVEAAEYARTPDLQRLGYLLELVELPELAGAILQVLRSRRRRPVLLSPGRAAGELERVDPWYILPNEEVEADL